MFFDAVNSFFNLFLPLRCVANKCLFLLALLVSRRSVSAYYTRFSIGVKGFFKNLGFFYQTPFICLIP
ncbi:Uncharacterised protein [Moraxella atlantae]|uniref:Uncharacterized protein n=1 Tax=Faucicola atlantae TaxID=34059 RepID=A0A378Q528_9GAMM|nr:hypothetical protein B5J92_05035 [Moraxella atlantae]STY95829.1 Uncharacterised protein [Moraxella atlantae]